ncbi:MAG: hypothetical protein ACTSR7_12995 [Promethearchaeota archaeon]
MADRIPLKYFRIFCFLIAIYPFYLSFFIQNYLALNSSFNFLISLSLFGIQAFFIFALVIFIDKTQHGSYFKKGAIFLPLLGGYVIIWVFFYIYINSWLFSNSIIDFSNGLIRYSIVSIFIIFSGIVKLITQRDKSLFLKIYRIWVSVESVISILLGNIILILSLIEFRALSFLFYVCMGLTVSSNILLAITGVRSIKGDNLSML